MSGNQTSAVSHQGPVFVPSPPTLLWFTVLRTLLWPHAWQPTTTPDAPPPTCREVTEALMLSSLCLHLSPLTQTNPQSGPGQCSLLGACPSFPPGHTSPPGVPFLPHITGRRRNNILRSHCSLHSPASAGFDPDKHRVRWTTRHHPCPNFTQEEDGAQKS